MRRVIETDEDVPLGLPESEQQRSEQNVPDQHQQTHVERHVDFFGSKSESRVPARSPIAV